MLLVEIITNVGSRAYHAIYPMHE